MFSMGFWNILYLDGLNGLDPGLLVNSTILWLWHRRNSKRWMVARISENNHYKYRAMMQHIDLQHILVWMNWNVSLVIILLVINPMAILMESIGINGHFCILATLRFKERCLVICDTHLLNNNLFWMILIIIIYLQWP